jgi:hypothetical protein
MRHSVRDVLSDLAVQTLRPDLVVIIDNGDVFDQDSGTQKYFANLPYGVKCFNPGINIGTNQVWNEMWCYTGDYDLVGVVGDDYRLNKFCLENLSNVILNVEEIRAATCTITRGRSVPRCTAPLQYRPVGAKGHMGLCLFESDALIELPTIPHEFFIFFGDNWMGWWLGIMKWTLYEVNTPIAHEHKTDLGEKLNYKDVIAAERVYWKSWLRGEIEL